MKKNNTIWRLQAFYQRFSRFLACFPKKVATKNFQYDRICFRFDLKSISNMLSNWKAYRTCFRAEKHVEHAFELKSINKYGYLWKLWRHKRLIIFIAIISRWKAWKSIMTLHDYRYLWILLNPWNNNQEYSVHKRNLKNCPSSYKILSPYLWELG